MESSSSRLSDGSKPKRLKTLACNVKFSGGNTLLHQFVLENSSPNESGTENYINAVLLSMSNVPADVVNALNDDGYSALHLAVLKNNLLMVKKLLACLVNTDVNAMRRGDENTPLHLAAGLGHSSIIRELLKKGAGIDIENREDETALCVAAKSRDLDIIKCLVSEGADLNRRGRRGTPLCHAVASGNLATVEFLVGCGADKRQARVTAAKSGNVDIMKFLFDGCVDFDIKSEYGFGLLIHAVASGNLAKVEIVVSSGADVNARSRETDNSALHFATMFRSLEIAEFLIDRGADLEARDESGATPLHGAVVIAGDLDIARLLIRKGADVDARDENGRTPLHRVAYWESSEIAAFLVDEGADVDARDDAERTPLHEAVSRGNLDIVKLLVDQGADLHARDVDGRTPLYFAVEDGSSECAAFLLNHGADLQDDEYGWTPLHAAAFVGHVDLARALLDRGADVNAKNEDGQTPLDLAREKQNQSCIDALQNVK